MTNAIEWTRDRLSAPRPSVTSPLTVEGETYEVTVEFFKGNLPRRMIRELSRAEKIQNDDVHECLYVAEKSNYVEFSRTTYTRLGA